MSKYDDLKRYLSGLGSVAVAFSGGVDSTFLLKAAREALGDRVIALTATSCFFPERELEEARAFCRELCVRHIVIHSDELKIEGIEENPKNRCYLCKKELFSGFLRAAAENGAAFVAEGSNMDDNGTIAPAYRRSQSLASRARCGNAVCGSRRSVIFPESLVFPRGKNSLLPASPPGLCMGKPSRKKSSAWWKKQSSFCWIWALLSTESGFTARWPG